MRARADAPGSRERSQQAVSALSGFDPSRTFRLGQFATGWYWGTCHTCGVQFMGDKRAFNCLACAADEAMRLLEAQRQTIKTLRAQTAIRCQHEPYQGRCVHCDVPFVGGRPALRDSDGSGVAGETAGLDPKGDSADPQGIAQTAPSPNPHGDNS